MALCRLSRTVHKKGVGGAHRSAQKVDYILREGAYVTSKAEARVRHLDQVPGGGRIRDDVVMAQPENLPAWANNDPVRFFTMAEEFERGGTKKKCGVVSTEWKITLPRELTQQQALEAGKDFMQTMLGDTHPYVWAMHDKEAFDGGRNPHIHCLWSSRTLDGIERSPEQFFRRYNAEHPEKGGAQKDPGLIVFGAARRERQAYSDLMNFHLERAGRAERLHPAQLKERGFDREPEPRVDPSDSNKARYQGIITEKWAEVMAHRQARFPHIDQEQRQAQRAWDRRKKELGIADVRTLDRAQLVALVAERTQHEALHPKPQPTLEELQAQLAKVEQVLAELEAHRDGKKKLPPHRMVGLLAQHERETTGRGLTMKLYEEEREYGR